MYGYSIVEIDDFEVYVLFDGRKKGIFEFYIKHKDYGDLMHMFGIDSDNIDTFGEDTNMYDLIYNNVNVYIDIYRREFMN